MRSRLMWVVAVVGAALAFSVIETSPAIERDDTDRQRMAQWESQLEEHEAALDRLRRQREERVGHLEERLREARASFERAQREMRRTERHIEELQDDGVGREHPKMRGATRELDAARDEVHEAEQRVHHLTVEMDEHQAEFARGAERHEGAIAELRAALAQNRGGRTAATETRRRNAPRQAASDRPRREAPHECRCEQVLERVERLEVMLRGMDGRGVRTDVPRPGPRTGPRTDLRHHSRGDGPPRDVRRPLPPRADETSEKWRELRCALEQCQAENRSLRDELEATHGRRRDGQGDRRQADLVNRLEAMVRAEREEAAELRAMNADLRGEIEELRDLLERRVRRER